MTLIVALGLAWLVASMAAVGMMKLMQGDDSYVFTLFSAAIAPMIWGIAFLIAAMRPVPRMALRKVGLWSLAALMIVFAGLSALEFSANGTLASGLSGVQLLLAMAASTAVAIIVQWLVFRWRAPPAEAKEMLFGRHQGTSS